MKSEKEKLKASITSTLQQKDKSKPNEIDLPEKDAINYNNFEISLGSRIETDPVNRLK